MEIKKCMYSSEADDIDISIRYSIVRHTYVCTYSKLLILTKNVTMEL